MESQRLIEIANDVENKSNKDLLIVVDELSEEFEGRLKFYKQGTIPEGFVINLQ